MRVAGGGWVCIYIMYAEKSHRRRAHSIRKIMAFFPTVLLFSLFSRACLRCILTYIQFRDGENRHHNNNHKLLPFCSPPAFARRMSRIHIVRIICIILYCVTDFWWFLSFDLFREFSRSQIRAWWLRWCTSVFIQTYLAFIYRGWPLSMYYEINKINNFNKKKVFVDVECVTTRLLYNITLDFVTNDIETSNNKKKKTNDILWQLQ